MASVQSEPAVYVYQTQYGGWRVTGSRVSLDSVVYLFKEGMTPEKIIEEFPALTLEQVYGAIAFYLRHQKPMDEYLQRQQELWERESAAAAERNRELRERIRQRWAELHKKNESP